MTDGLERTLEALLFLSADPVSGEALADAVGAELHEVMTGQPCAMHSMTGKPNPSNSDG